MNLRKFGFTIVLLLIGHSLIGTSVADTLEDLQNSTVLNRFSNESRQNQRRQASKTWLPASKNFSRLFAHIRGPDLLHAWVNLPTTRFKTTDEMAMLLPEYALATKAITAAKTSHEFEVSIYVPHPRYEQMAKHKLIKKMAELEPPLLNVEYSEELVLQGFKAELHQHKNEPSCSLVIHMGEKEAILNIEGLCKHNKEITKLAEYLTLQRFKDKLSS